MRVRFPPSPTGALHIGNARTALYNWLLARGSGGQLVLRIEDTDRERSTPENVELIFDSLDWLGIDWDEGPIYQTANAGRHAEVVQQLLDSGQAYRSTAGPEQVKAFKEANGNRGFRGTDEGEGAVRLRMPDEGATIVRDIIRGESAFENVLQDDLVIARADGTPIYHLAVVVDDHDAGITHVVRGADHYSNTPKHMRIYEAMGAEPPTYAHLPLLHGPDGKKLSKRHGAASVQDLRNSGYLREAVINYLALLGWGYDETTTFFTIEQLQELFSLERVSKNPAVFDEQKLRWINGRYVRELSRRRPDGAPGGVHGPHRPARRGRDHAGEDLDARASSGRWPARSTTGRSMTRRRARSSSSRRSRGRRWRDVRDGAGGTSGAVERRDGRGGAARRRRAHGAQTEADLPAFTGRFDRNDRFTRYLRDGRAAGARRDPREGGACA